MNYAQISDEGIAVRTLQVPDGFTLAQCLQADLVPLFQHVPDEVSMGSFKVDGVWHIAAPPAVVDAPPPAPVPTALNITKRAFQNRFPPLADGVSTKYDVMTMFLDKDSYAATLVADDATRVQLQLLVTTGLNRFNSSGYVNLLDPETAAFTLLLMQPTFPDAFRLTADERTAILTAPVEDGERY